MVTSDGFDDRLRQSPKTEQVATGISVISAQHFLLHGKKGCLPAFGQRQNVPVFIPQSRSQHQFPDIMKKTTDEGGVDYLWFRVLAARNFPGKASGVEAVMPWNRPIRSIPPHQTERRPGWRGPAP